MGDVLTLYRGIAIAKEKVDIVIMSIRSRGILGDEGYWDFTVEDLRGRIDTLFRKKDLSTTDTRGTHLDSYRAICTCGDELGASFYALVHNRHQGSDEESYVIEFTTPVKYVSVDGRDFLYTSFQLWDRETTAHYEVQSKALAHLFGPSVLKYFQRAANSRDQDFRIAMCDLACQDFEIVLAHAMNSSPIRGRYGVTFRSAFFVKAPVQPTQILNVRPAKKHEFSPVVMLDDFLKGKLQAFVS